MNIDERFMYRAIQLAKNGKGNTSPNPMVGAVIVHGGMIIGEGYHRRCGEGHAEVNAVASVKDRALLKDSTIYVTLEPCSHYGKTPPCAKLIIDSGIPRVVIGSPDPSDKVNGRGINMLREAGVEVATGVLERQCRELNPAFMTCNTLGRPYVTLKWAQSADGYIDRKRTPSDAPSKFSTPVTSALSHRLRTLNDAIMVGSGTMLYDRPSLTARLWPGNDPLRVAADRSGVINPEESGFTILGHEDGGTVASYLKTLRDKGVTSVLVEGGTKLLQAFIDSGMWDTARAEVAPVVLGDGVKAPRLPICPTNSLTIGNNHIYYYDNPDKQSLKTTKNIK